MVGMNNSQLKYSSVQPYLGSWCILGVVTGFVKMDVVTGPTELTPSTPDLPSQNTDVSLPCKYSNFEKCLTNKEDKRNYSLIFPNHTSQKENMFLNDSSLCENSARSCQNIIDKKHLNLFEKVCDFKDFTIKHNNTNQNLIHTLHSNYTCNVCNKYLKGKRSLIKHLLVHSEQRKYKCDVCDKGFKMKCNLNKHLLIHSK
uniref:C2H2-type domain-containing protein n=1 Tax=Timema cristinae TaxID=61476 RepID=A0A7R9H7M2_TIMCR|nr:unnamed protein product [Timema cristinae]